ncbi:MAG: L,D-transpeptidase family protein [Sphingomonadaceae bacterium]
MASSFRPFASLALLALLATPLSAQQLDYEAMLSTPAQEADGAESGPEGRSADPAREPAGGDPAAPTVQQSIVRDPAPSSPRALVRTMLSEHWSAADARQLLSYIEAVGKEGLNPADYEPERLRNALETGDAEALQPLATQIYLKLATDLATGKVGADARVEWYVEDDPIDAGSQYAMLNEALREDDIAGSLNALLPTHPQYGHLKNALAATDPADAERRELLLANMERWRWLPRDLGEKYVIVNVPAFTATLVEDNKVVTRKRAVVGKPGTPTPQLSTLATGVVLNPWWELPQSIIKEVGPGAPGYITQREGDYVRMRQPPGPRNALGRLKVKMLNPHAIYLHDTPAKALFNKKVRAFSHGCIRTQDVFGLAEELLAGTDWDRGKIAQGIGTGKTMEVDFAEPVPVYIVYFTAGGRTDGTVTRFADLYGRDKPVRTALKASGGARSLASSD